ncbi:MAG: 16S rRNA (cytidine(1402)-2'-O)-methyltransferase [Sulfuricellaceae bacterium]|nr:16S rRNA (cytidine(1402)-2'-O)-methyltransferase [Sulfuricellaceae bacterium]
MKGTLYVVATPIGNLKDISLRALEILAQADFIAAEDTRHASHLLNHYAISTKLLSLHEHNERSATDKIIALLDAGKTVALISDAGTPAISDPGAYLVAVARRQGIVTVPIPGANAAISALSAAGISDPHFLFYGFLPSKRSSRRQELEAFKDFPHTLVYYEAPHRILECVSDLADILGSKREITIARELSKAFESIHSCALGDVLDWLNADSNRQRGEFVLLISGKPPEMRAAGISDESKRVLALLVAELPLKQAVKLAAAISGEKKNALYAEGLTLKKETD